MNKFYVYAYLRDDGSPYYIGKGSGNRAWSKSRKGFQPPSDASRIVLIKEFLSEDDAFNLERAGIVLFGRKDLGTGVLRNLTDGGEGSSGVKPSKETKEKTSMALKGVPKSEAARIKMSENNAKLKPGYGVVTHLVSGETWSIQNISEFCRKMGLHNGHLVSTSTGKRKHHKGYKLDWVRR